MWEGPETPQAWLTAMARKKASLSRWEGAVARGDLLDQPVDLSNLFNPNTFLNAVRQQVSAPHLSFGLSLVRMKDRNRSCMGENPVDRKVTCAHLLEAWPRLGSKQATGATGATGAKGDQ